MMRRVLSLWQPHATLCVARDPSRYPARPPKGVETRHFEPRFPLPIDVVIHATKKWSGELGAIAESWPFYDVLHQVGYTTADPRRAARRGEAVDKAGRKYLPLGALIGVATIVAVSPTTSLLASWSQFEDGAAESYAEEIAFGNYRPGRFGWVFANQRELPRPIPFWGRQDVLYPVGPEYEAVIDQQLAEATP